MQTDIRQLYSNAVDRSHHGRPTLIEPVHTGERGRPSYWIHPGFLQWALSMGKSTSAIAHYLNVSRSTVRTNLLRYGIAEPQPDPFSDTSSNSGSFDFPTSAMSQLSNDVVDLANDDLLDPHLEENSLQPDARSQAVHNEHRITSYTGSLSTISDDDLDRLVIHLRSHYRRAGVTHLDGMLLSSGHRVPRERIRQSLARVDPVQRIFQRIPIRRRTYKVAGPNALWHHDGQHGSYCDSFQNSRGIFLTRTFIGLIRWGIVIHGFIDGYSRLITGLRASDNNRAQTVLDLFMSATAAYAIPSRVRGDHGVASQCGAFRRKQLPCEV